MKEIIEKAIQDGETYMSLKFSKPVVIDPRHIKDPDWWCDDKRGIRFCSHTGEMLKEGEEHKGADDYPLVLDDLTLDEVKQQIQLRKEEEGKWNEMMDYLRRPEIFEYTKRLWKFGLMHDAVKYGESSLKYMADWDGQYPARQTPADGAFPPILPNYNY